MCVEKGLFHQIPLIGSAAVGFGDRCVAVIHGFAASESDLSVSGRLIARDVILELSCIYID